MDATQTQTDIQCSGLKATHFNEHSCTGKVTVKIKIHKNTGQVLV